MNMMATTLPITVAGNDSLQPSIASVLIPSEIKFAQPDASLYELRIEYRSTTSKRSYPIRVAGGSLCWPAGTRGNQS